MEFLHDPRADVLCAASVPEVEQQVLFVQRGFELFLAWAVGDDMGPVAFHGVQVWAERPLCMCQITRRV